MNEGENSGMPNTPVFSSPNTSPNPQPDQPASPAGSNASVIAAAASLPGEDPSQPAGVISSGDSTPAGARPRFGFSRKFKAKTAEQQLPAQPAFSNAPDYFSQAVDDIVAADNSAIEKKKNMKKIAIIALAVLVAAAVIIAVILLIQQSAKPSAGKVRTAFNRFANYVLYGEEKDGDIGELSETTRYTMMDKYINTDETFNNRFKELFDNFYKEYNAAAKNGIYKKGEMGNYRAIVHDVYNSFDMDKGFSYDDIVGLYKTYSATIVNEQISQKYETYKKSSDSQLTNSWYKARSAISRIVEIYNGNGCIYLGRIEWSCSADPSSSQDLKEALADAAEYMASEKREYENARINIWRSLWTVRDYIKE